MENRDQTSNKKAPSFTPRTPLAKRLWELRQEVVASGVPLLNLDEIRQELQARRAACSTRRKRDTDLSRCRHSHCRHPRLAGDRRPRYGAAERPGASICVQRFVQLELLPKAVYFRHTAEASFYQAYFASVTEMVPVSQALVAKPQSRRNGQAWRRWMCCMWQRQELVRQQSSLRSSALGCPYFVWKG